MRKNRFRPKKCQKKLKLKLNTKFKTRTGMSSVRLINLKFLSSDIRDFKKFVLKENPDLKEMLKVFKEKKTSKRKFHLT